MDFRVFDTTLGQVLLRRDNDDDKDVLRIHWFVPGAQVTMSLGVESEDGVKQRIQEATPEWAERWVRQQAALFP